MVTFVFEQKWASAVLGAMFPAEPGQTDAPDLGAGFSSIIRSAPFEAGIGLRLALFMVILAPLFVLGRPRTFMGLDAPSREKLLDALMKSSMYAVRQLLMALKTMGALVYARDEKTRRRLMAPRKANANASATARADADADAGVGADADVLVPAVSGLISLRRKDTTHAA
jgi:hypothetical protein